MGLSRWTLSTNRTCVAIITLVLPLALYLCTQRPLAHVRVSAILKCYERALVHLRSSDSRVASERVLIYIWPVLYMRVHKNNIFPGEESVTSVRPGTILQSCMSTRHLEYPRNTAWGAIPIAQIHTRQSCLHSLDHRTTLRPWKGKHGRKLITLWACCTTEVTTYSYT